MRLGRKAVKAKSIYRKQQGHLIRLNFNRKTDENQLACALGGPEFPVKDKTGMSKPTRRRRVLKRPFSQI